MRAQSFARHKFCTLPKRGCFMMFHTIEFNGELMVDLEISPRHRLGQMHICRGTRLQALVLRDIKYRFNPDQAARWQSQVTSYLSRLLFCCPCPYLYPCPYLPPRREWW